MYPGQEKGRTRALSLGRTGGHQPLLLEEAESPSPGGEEARKPHLHSVNPPHIQKRTT